VRPTGDMGRTPTLSHGDHEGTLADLPPGEGDVDGVLPLLDGLVGAAVAAVALVLDGAGHRGVLAGGVDDHHLHLANTSA